LPASMLRSRRLTKRLAVNAKGLKPIRGCKFEAEAMALVPSVFHSPLQAKPVCNLESLPQLPDVTITSVTQETQLDLPPVSCTTYQGRAPSMAGVKKRIMVTVMFTFLFFVWLWCLFAIYFFGLPGNVLPLIAASLFGLGVPLALIFLPNRRRTVYGVSALCAGIILGWSQIEPSHDRNWARSVAQLPRITTEGDQIRVFNIRNFDYRAPDDFSVQYYDKTFDLNKLETADYVLSYWDGMEAIAHTIISFGFGDGDYLAVSVETRLEQGEPQTGLGGLFKQYELIYILADEKDLLRLRSNFRKEEVFLYPTTLNKKEVRKIFGMIVERVNSIANKPEFYSTISQNCLTTLAKDFSKVMELRSSPLDYRRFLSGYSDELMFEHGRIDSNRNFEDTRRLHYINQYVQADNHGDGYSRKIRPHIKNKTDQGIESQ